MRVAVVDVRVGATDELPRMARDSSPLTFTHDAQRPAKARVTRRWWPA